MTTSGSNQPRQRVVVYHEGGAATCYGTAYGNEQAMEAMLSCHRDHPGASVEVLDAATYADEQEYIGGLDPLI